MQYQPASHSAVGQDSPGISQYILDESNTRGRYFNQNVIKHTFLDNSVPKVWEKNPCTNTPQDPSNNL